MTSLESQNLTDAELIARSKDRPDLFGELFDRHYARVHRYVARRLDVDLADDVTAEAFARAFALRDRYDVSRPDASPWIFGIASNLMRTHSRAEVRLYRALARAHAGTVADFSPAAIERADAASQKTALYEGLSRLSKADRNVVLLHVWGELPLTDVSESLGIPEGTARSRLARARNQLSPSLNSLEEARPVSPATTNEGPS